MRWMVCVLILVGFGSAGAALGDGVLFVDDDAPAGGDGLSWATAFSDLHDALAAAREPRSVASQIRMGQGVYQDGGVDYELVAGVSVIGGYAGIDAEDPNLRDLSQFVTEIRLSDIEGTVSSGDQGDFVLNGLHIVAGELFVAGHLSINGDFPVFAKLRVVDVSFTGALSDNGAVFLLLVDAVFERCHFADNHAFGYNGSGGAIHALASILEVNSCSFMRNTCNRLGGAVHLDRSRGKFTDTVFVENGTSKSIAGGAIEALSGIDSEPINSQLVIERCRFLRNGGPLLEFGGAVSAVGYPTIIRNCEFRSNQADGMSAVKIEQATGTVENCAFFENHSRRFGAVSLPNSRGLVSGCVFSGNVDEGEISAIYLLGSCYYCDVVVRGSTIVNNESEHGVAIGQMDYGFGTYTGMLSVENSIVWGNHSVAGVPGEIQIDPPVFEPVVRYSCVQNPSSKWVTENLIDTDPLFRDPLGADGIEGTEDDDYRLRAGSPCVDAGDNTVLKPGNSPVSGTTNLLDLDGRARRIDSPLSPDVGNGLGAIVDMGAFEFQAGDVDDDFVVSLADFEGWKACVAEPADVGCLMLDFDGDGDVDLFDWSGFQIAFDRGS